MSRLIDDFGRKVDYLRISITDRCNLRCYYCMPPQGVKLLAHKQLLSYEEIIRVVKVGIKLGIKKVRLTGGEPLVRPKVITLVRMLKNLSAIEDLAITTNGILLNKYGQQLSQAGLDRVNISLDTLKADKFNQITGYDRQEQVLAGIKRALEVGLDPVKINVVLMKGINDDEVFDFINLTKEYPIHVRFIEFMPVGDNTVKQSKRYLGIDQLKKKISREEELLPTQFKEGNGPAYYYQVPNSLGTIGFISPMSNHFCGSCNRLRLTATGQLRPCLSSDQEINLKQVLRAGKSDQELTKVFINAINKKPQTHVLNNNDDSFSKNMSQIGG
jgi:cyclic pyranopterin phosphate synthase